MLVLISENVYRCYYIRRANNMEQEFLLAIVMAAVVFLLTIYFGDEIGKLIASAGSIMVIMPVFLYFIFGMFGMLNSDPKTSQAIADSTITNIVNYVANQLPGIIISDIAGAIVGAVGGVIVKALGYFS